GAVALERFVAPRDLAAQRRDFREVFPQRRGARFEQRDVTAQQEGAADRVVGFAGIGDQRLGRTEREPLQGRQGLGELRAVSLQRLALLGLPGLQVGELALDSHRLRFALLYRARALDHLVAERLDLLGQRRGLGGEFGLARLAFTDFALDLFELLLARRLRGLSERRC